jgi:hypothetical protein
MGAAGETVITGYHGKFYETNYRGNVFYASQASTGLAISIFSAAAQNFLVVNPANSGINCVPIRCLITYVSGADIAGHMCIGASLTAQAAPGTLTAAPNLFPGRPGAASTGKTLIYTPGSPAVALTYHSALDLNFETAVAASTNAAFKTAYDFEGSFIAPPGSTFSIASNVAQTTRISVISLIYEEVPV